jgi:glycosyltransferase involved in cell wall biosynthesis
LGAAVALLPWIAVRGVWNWLMRAIGRDGRLTWVDYVFDWRTNILPWCDAAVRATPPADLHHGNDLDALYAAASAARRDRAPYVYDSHEVFMAWGRHAAQPWPVRAIMARWERRLAQRAAAVITVNDECADELERRLGIPRPVVVRNCAPRWTPPEPAADPLRTAAGVPEGTDVVLCHGGFQAGRGLEETALAMREPGLERAHLVFLGYGHGFLDDVVADPAIASRVHRLPAVPPDELLGWIAPADVDVAVFRAVDLNHVLSTPNKLFESLAAGVPVVSSDTPARRRIVIDDPDGPLGAVCDATPEAIAAAIRGILELGPDARADLRRRCRTAAAERWNWDHESTRLLAAYAGAVASAPTSPAP